MKTSGLITWASIAVLSVGSAGCDTIWGKKIKAGYCADHASDSDCRSSFPDAGDDGRCTSNATCMAPTAVCDITGSMTCVQCIASTDTAACAGTMPVCGADHACHPCSKHSDCALSSACLPDGSCALAENVAYVQAGASGTMCTQMSPCGTLDAGVKANRPYVKVGAGTLADASGTVIDGKAVTILADPGAKLSRTGPGVILTVQNDGADVKIYDLQITGGTGLSNPGISIQSGGAPKLALTRVIIDANQGVGISNGGGGALRIEQSTVSGNQGVGISNAGGGALRIEQSTISGNQGVGISSAGGGALRIEQSTVSGNQGVGISSAGGGALEISRSTISGNQGGGILVTGGNLSLSQSDISSNLGGGISVSGVGVTFDITNNFVYRNGNQDASAFGGLMLGIAVAGTNRMEFNTVVDNRAVINSGGVVCNATTFAAPNNIIARNALGTNTTAPGAQVSPGGCTYPTSKIQSDVTGLAFVHPEAPGALDYRLTGDSTAIDQALTASPIAVDHDGKTRPAGSGKDIGAFEFKP